MHACRWCTPGEPRCGSSSLLQARSSQLAACHTSRKARCPYPSSLPPCLLCCVLLVEKQGAPCPSTILPCLLRCVQQVKKQGAFIPPVFLPFVFSRCPASRKARGPYPSSLPPCILRRVLQIVQQGPLSPPVYLLFLFSCVSILLWGLVEETCRIGG